MKNVNKIEEFAAQSRISNLRYVESIRGFNPDNIFRQHLQTLGLGDCFFKKHLSKNRYTGDNTPTSDAVNLDTLQSTIELYKQQGKIPSEKSVQSADNTPKITTSRSIAPMAQHNKKETQNSSNQGGDKNPPRSKIDSSHKLPVKKKRKKIVGQAKDIEI